MARSYRPNTRPTRWPVTLWTGTPADLQARYAAGVRGYNACPVASLHPKPVLRIRGLACSTGYRLLFQGVDATLGPGAALELTGANGSGKTTLLRCVAGLFKQDAGTVCVGGAAQAFYLGHKSGMNPLLTPLENLRWQLALEGRTAAARECAEALRAFGLGDQRHEPCGRLSAGQQRRGALARLLLSEASLWLLDEPLNALDAEGQRFVYTLIGKRRESGGAVICATHGGLELPGAQRLELPA